MAGGIVIASRLAATRAIEFSSRGRSPTADRIGIGHLMPPRFLGGDRLQRLGQRVGPGVAGRSCPRASLREFPPRRAGEGRDLTGVSAFLLDQGKGLGGPNYAGGRRLRPFPSERIRLALSVLELEAERGL